MDEKNINLAIIIEKVAKLIVSPSLSSGIEAFMATEAMFSEKLIEDKRKKGVEEWLDSFVKNNTGTVVDRDVFWKHLKNECLIEKVKRFVFEDDNNVSEIKFIGDLTSECYSYCQEYGSSVHDTDRVIINSFFIGLINEFKPYYD